MMATSRMPRSSPATFWVIALLFSGLQGGEKPTLCHDTAIGHDGGEGQEEVSYPHRKYVHNLVIPEPHGLSHEPLDSIDFRHILKAYRGGSFYAHHT